MEKSAVSIEATRCSEGVETKITSDTPTAQNDVNLSLDLPSLHTPGNSTDVAESLSPTPSAASSSTIVMSPREHEEAGDFLCDDDNLPPRPEIDGLEGTTSAQCSLMRWNVGQKVEAKDADTWYSARIVKVDQKELKVTVHYDGWHRRYDRKLDFFSEYLRPSSRPSQRKERSLSHEETIEQEFSPGDLVYAKWTDCRQYPAKVLRALDNGSYEVLFYDGYKKAVHPMNMKSMPPEVQSEIRASDIFAQGEKKYKKQEMKKLQRREAKQQQKKAKATKSAPVVKEEVVEDVVEPGAQQAESTAEVKLEATSTEQTMEPTTELVEAVAMATTVKSAASRRKSSSKRKTSIGESREAKKAKVPPQAQEDVVEFDRLGDDSLKVSEKAKRRSEAEVIQQNMLDQENKKFWAPREFKVESDHNEYKCPFHKTCDKGFRKQSLLDSHIKYYHKEDGTLLEPGEINKKRRKHAGSIDSENGGAPKDVSKSKKKSRVSRESVSSVTSPVPSDRKEISEAGSESEEEEKSAAPDDDRYVSQSDLSEEEDAPDRLRKDEVVNCVCGQNEENGLMIQCEFCLCWQHALCVGLDAETLPKKYICNICQDPPGVRDSARWQYNQDWHQKGTFARFDLLPADEEREARKSPIILATHDLAADLLRTQQGLATCRAQISLIDKKPEPDFSRWCRTVVKKKDGGDADDVTNRIDLLRRVMAEQDVIEHQCDFLEEQVSALEAAENSNSGRQGDVLSDLPRIKKLLHQLLHDLDKVKQMSLYH